MAPKIKNPDTMNLNIRNFPVDLYYKCQEVMGRERIPTMGEFVIKTLREVLYASPASGETD